VRRRGGYRPHSQRLASNGMGRLNMRLDGRARLFGDDVNTDYVISSARKRASIDPDALAEFLFESHAPGFAASVEPDDILVAGRNFGCGSAMEIAVTVIQAAGIHAVLARSFSRSFYRNAINNGLLVVLCDTSSIEEGDRLSITLKDGEATVTNVTRQVSVAGAPLPAIMLRILEAGGLIGFLRNQRGWGDATP
jgi:3-isopropylmalate/(R)-2-methylmalate dehydratase small subunit